MRAPIPQRIAPLSWRKPAFLWTPAALAIAIGFFARSKGFSMGLGIAIALFTSFPVAWLIVWLLPIRVPTTPDGRPDPMHRLQIELEKARVRAEQQKYVQDKYKQASE